MEGYKEKKSKKNHCLVFTKIPYTSKRFYMVDIKEMLKRIYPSEEVYIICKRISKYSDIELRKIHDKLIAYIIQSNNLRDIDDEE